MLHALALAAALVWAMPQRATAQVTRAVISADGSYNVPVSAPFAASGVGLGARLGARVGLPSAQETWELGFDYTSLGPADARQPTAGYAAYRGVVGVRLGFDSIIEPGIFMHAGLGHVDGYIATMGTNPAPMVQSLSHTAFTWDGGAYLDIKLARFLEIGFQASYDEIVKAANARALHWFALSAHIQLVM